MEIKYNFKRLHVKKYKKNKTNSISMKELVCKYKYIWMRLLD